MIFQNKLRVNRVAGRLVNLVAAEVAVKFVFVVVVAAEVEFLAVGREFLFFIQHDKLRFAPGLSWAADIAPEFEIGFVIAASDKIITWRFRGILLRHCDFRGLNSGGGGFASGQEKEREKSSEQEKEAPHLATCLIQSGARRNVASRLCFRERHRKFRNDRA